MALLDCGGATLRRYGGLGVSIHGIPVQVLIQPSSEFNLEGLDHLDPAGQRDATSVVARFAVHLPLPNATVSIDSTPPQHVGLGVKTALLLALVRALSMAGSRELDSPTLQKLTGRGGTSGIGIHAFFSGGFIIDVGHPANQAEFLPSSARRPASLPLKLLSHPSPAAWQYALLLPRGKRLSGMDEVAFFRRNTPISRDEVHAALAYAYHGVAPAVLSGDITALKMALHHLQRTGFKAREVQAQDEEVQQLMVDLEDHTSAVVGLSSLGPLVYAICDREDKIGQDEIRHIASRRGVEVLGTFPGHNRGFEVRH